MTARRTCTPPSAASGKRPAPCGGSARGTRGIALVTVLAIVLLLTIPVTSLLLFSASERGASAREGGQWKARILADTAFNLVVGQLRQATGGELSGRLPVPWTSQPGAIRTYDAHGGLTAIHKLYSAAFPVAQTAEELDADVPEDWRGRPDEFVDLNAPAVSEDSLRFPSVDPRAMTRDRNQRVEGFDYVAGRAGAVGPQRSPRDQRLPMPVRWLYVLQDGSFGNIDRGKFLGTSQPTRENPIVGRVAFWTDDECCKINVNTASEGVYWDTPRATGGQDRRLAEFQPARGEFQRYPGHPAQVSLSSVLFPNRRLSLPGDGTELKSDGTAMASLSLEEARALWEMSPGVSADPERTTDGARHRAARIDDPGYTPPPGIATPARYHLHPTPAEVGLNERRTLHPVLARSERTRERLSEAGFFLTAHSAGPEITLHGTPRVSLWPVYGGTGVAERATVFDRTMAFVSTVGGRRYHVQRGDAKNGWWDFYKGSGGQNAELFEYLSRLTDRPAPGFAPRSGPRSFGEKYGTGLDGDRDQILVSMLDYIRQTNMNDGNLEWNYQFSIICPGQPEQGYGQITPLSTVGGADFRVTRPLTPEERHGARGIGRILTISEVALIFSCRAIAVDDGKGGVTVRGRPTALNKRLLTKAGDREVEIGLLVEGFVPAQGWTDYRPYCSLALGGTPQTDAAAEIGAIAPPMSVSGRPLELPESRTLRSTSTGTGSPGRWMAWGGTIGARCFTSNAIAFKPLVFSSGETLIFSGCGTPGSAGVPNLLRLGVYDEPEAARITGTSTNADLMQIVPLPFPAFDGLPLPDPPPDGSSPVPLEERYRSAQADGHLLTDGDVVQSLVPAHGDYRLIAARRMAATPDGRPDFAPHPLWGRVRQAHSLREPLRGVGATAATSPGAAGFFPDLELPAYAVPDYPVNPANRAHAALNRLDGMRRGPAEPALTGDFDNGVAAVPDGAYINRADDGEIRGYSRGVPYFDAPPTDPMALPHPSKAAFSPNRLLPGAAMFGSLPTGVRAGVPWQTLLFRPQEELDPARWSAATDHYGWKTPRDHLFLDLFWMPTVEPYPISVPLATAGKINLNHVIVPFSHIHRTTALHALLKNEKVMAIPDTAAAEYKRTDGYADEQWRHYIDAAATLRRWREDVFDSNRTFLSAGEICEHYLIPEGSGASTRTDMARYWKRHRLTGDNTRERPYANLLGRLTTRSNVFRIHVVAQSLQQPGLRMGELFDRDRDTVAAEVAGSLLVERSIDPTDPDLPDYVAEIAAGRTPPPLDRFHCWRLSRFEQFSR